MIQILSNLLFVIFGVVLFKNFKISKKKIKIKKIFNFKPVVFIV